MKLENGEPKQIAGFRTGIYSFRSSTAVAVAVICIIIDKIGNSTLHKYKTFLKKQKKNLDKLLENTTISLCTYVR